MESKRTYKKHKTELTVSVKHYINRKTRITLEDGSIHHPLYVQLIAKQKTTLFKSKINTLNAPIEVLERWLDEDEHWQQILEREAKNIKTLTQSQIKELGENFHVSAVTEVYKNFAPDFGTEVRKELSKILCKIHDNENGILFDQSHIHQFYDIHPLILLNKWGALEGVKQLKNQYSSELWNFDYYYLQFLNSGLVSQYIYTLLEPTLLDFENGKLQIEMLDFFKPNNQELSIIFDDLKKIFKNNI